MKKILLLSLLFIAFSCGTNKEPQNKEKEQQTYKKDYASFLASLQRDVQTFQISSAKDTTLKGEFGIIVEIDPEALEMIDGSALGEKIDVELIEIKDKKDFIVYNVPTVSDGKMLISDGAFYLNMKSDGKEVKIKKDKSIQVKFPANSKEEMELFYGESDKNGDFNWKPGNKKLLPQKISFILEDDGSERITMIELSSGEENNLSVEDDISTLIPSDGLGQEMGDSTSNSRSLPPLYTYEIKLDKFGWINCDRFLGDERPQTTVGLEISDEFIGQTGSYLVFKSINSVMYSWSNKDFVNIPIGEEVELLSIAKNEDKIFVYQKTFKVKKDETINLEMKEMSEDKLKEILDKL